jgi:hypothetical protein
VSYGARFVGAAVATHSSQLIAQIKKEAAHISRRKPGPPPRTGYPESENLLPSSSSIGHRLNCSVCGLASGAPASIPGWFAAIQFTSVSTASRLNRGSTSCTARRRATATWTGRAIGLVLPNENDQFSNWRRQHRNKFSLAQGSNFYPHILTLLTYPHHLTPIVLEARRRIFRPRYGQIFCCGEPKKKRAPLTAP